MGAHAQDAGSTLVAFLTEECEDLAGSIVVTFQESADGALEGIELAGAWRAGGQRVGTS